MISRRKLIVIATLFMLIYMYIWRYMRTHTARWYNQKAVCETPADVYADMVQLTFMVSATLNKLKVPHFLCYGTLWGAIRIGKILPWDNNVDICVIDTDVSVVDEGFFHLEFRRAGIKIGYSSQSGVYTLQYKKATGEITVFRQVDNEMMRAGWEARILPELKFPTRLLKKPFPTSDFHDSQFPVPSENFEIMKYLYPEDWWQAMRPPGC